MAYVGSYRDAVYANTFGHLAIKKNTTYKGELIFAISEFGASAPIMITFNLKDNKNNEVESSPWLFKSLNDALHKNYWGWQSDLRRSANVPTGVYNVKVTVRNYRIWLPHLSKLTNILNLE